MLITMLITMLIHTTVQHMYHRDGLGCSHGDNLVLPTPSPSSQSDQIIWEPMISIIELLACDKSHEWRCKWRHSGINIRAPITQILEINGTWLPKQRWYQEMSVLHSVHSVYHCRAERRWCRSTYCQRLPLENKLLYKHKLFSHSLQLNPPLDTHSSTSGAYTLPLHDDIVAFISYSSFCRGDKNVLQRLIPLTPGGVWCPL